MKSESTHVNLNFIIYIKQILSKWFCKRNLELQVTHLWPYELGTILEKYWDGSGLEAEMLVENLNLPARALHD